MRLYSHPQRTAVAEILIDFQHTSHIPISYDPKHATILEACHGFTYINNEVCSNLHMYILHVYMYI